MRIRSARAPLVAGWALRRARGLFDPLARLGSRARADGIAIPPRRLRARTGAPGIDDFDRGGRAAALELSQALGSAGPGLDRFASVLDFGCGSARVLPHVASLLPSASCTGCDVDPRAIAWAARNHPELSFSVSPFGPPLAFADESFDLVYSISVFSHLDQALAEKWLLELRRVLRARGVALLSIHGTYAFDQFRTGAVRTGWCRAGAFDRPPLSAAEFAFEPYMRSIWNRSELPGVGGSYGLAFHGRDYIMERWSETLEVLDVLPRAMTSWQDIVVCRKPA